MSEIGTFLSPFLFRGLERLMITLFAGLCVYWGYRLFDHALDSEGQLQAQGKGFKFGLKRVAPGVFFALFGAVVLCTGLFNPITSTHTSSEGNSQDSIVWGTFGIATDADKSQCKDAIYGINRVLRYHETGAPKDKTEKQELDDAMNRLRSHRRYLVDRIVARDSISKYSEWAIKIRQNPSCIDQLSKQDQDMFKTIKSLLEE
jgi:hypothetical protein